MFLDRDGAPLTVGYNPRTSAVHQKRPVKVDSAIFDATLDRLQRETRAIIDDHWLAVKAVAKALFERDRLDQAEVESLMVAALPHLRRDVSGHLAPTHAQ